MSETSLIRVSRKNKEIIQAIKLTQNLKNEDEAVDVLISNMDVNTITYALSTAHAQKTRWLHELKEEIEK